MINWLNKSGQKIPLENYTYSAGNEPSWYEFGSDTSGFDTYMGKLLVDNNFPITSNPNPTESFDEAFATFINSSQAPDKFSTRSWLMNSPKYAT